MNINQTTSEQVLVDSRQARAVVGVLGMLIRMVGAYSSLGIILQQARSDVYVDTDVVGPDLAWPAEMNSGFQLWAKAIDADLRCSLTRFERGLDGIRCIRKDGHHSVAEPLHHLSPAIADGRLDRRAELPQQLDGQLVARL